MRQVFAAFVFSILASPLAAAEISLDLGTARLRLDERTGTAALTLADGTAWPAADQPAFALQTEKGLLVPTSLRLAPPRLTVTFEGGSTAEFLLDVRPGLAVFRLTKFEPKGDVNRFRLFRLGLPPTAQIGGTLNCGYAGPITVAVMAAEPNIRAWSDGALNLETVKSHGLEPAAFGVLVAPREEFLTLVERFEQAAGVPSPKLDGVWNKRSPAIRRSYFFLTSFSESQFDEALAIARRGGFDAILIGQESWCRATGHYEVNTAHFPDGLEGLKRTVARFKAAGFKVGLHCLAASIDPPDPYLTPVPDPRLVHRAKIALAADVDEKADFIPTAAAPEQFPAEDGGYEGDGAVLQIGDELVQYTARSMTAPFGFSGCRRGHLGTKPAPHKKGDPAAHLLRSYGYHLFDIDSTLLDEVTTNFARVANACDIDMIYFDGSERLQGDHWYYNARLQKAFYDKLAKKDVLLQGSSYTHYSWHLMARSASADGHGDLKGYLDERSPWFSALGRDGMPLDIGWYYGYDASASLDMYEYILGATIGYDSSMSFQVSPDAAARHPFTGEILDLISRYEALRLSGRVPDAMKARLRIDPVLGGDKKPEERAKLLDLRREYRLLVGPPPAAGAPPRAAFQRVIYEPWHEVRSAEPAETAWNLVVKDAPASVGFQIHVQSGHWLRPGPSYDDPAALVLETFDDLAPYASKPKGEVRAIGPGESGAVSPGVTQRLELRDDGTGQARRYALYTAESTRSDTGGWSFIGRTFNPPLDLSWHKGIGFWLRGDGKGGAFKLQLCDDRGAMDYYVPNNYVGWRYQQLARPAKDPIDYAKVRALNFYYNGLPAKTAVSCGIDDVKALRGLDRQSLQDPWVEVAGQRLAWKGTLTEGQYLVLWPGEPPEIYGPERPKEMPKEPFVSTPLPAGQHAVRFGCAGSLSMPVRVRLTLQPPERHEIP